MTFTQEELRDLGVIMLSNGVHVHMTGPDDVTTHFSVDGFIEMTDQQFKEWAWEALDTALGKIDSNLSFEDSWEIYGGGGSK